MTDAVERFFPESGILDSPLVHPPDDEKVSQHRSDFSLRRMPTGASSLVGEDNGERPGGFVLVIDGIALEHVSLAGSSSVSVFNETSGIRRGVHPGASTTTGNAL